MADISRMLGRSKIFTVRSLLLTNSRSCPAHVSATSAVYLSKLCCGDLYLRRVAPVFTQPDTPQDISLVQGCTQEICKYTPDCKGRDNRHRKLGINM